MVKNTTPTVDAIEKIHISGDIIPPAWFKHITYTTEQGKTKPDLLAIYILANIRYWYTPTTIRDPKTDQVTTINKKFHSDKLQKSYADYAELTGYSKRQVRDSFNTLKQLGLITIELRILKNKGVLLYNVMFVEPNPQRISEITFNYENVSKENASQEDTKKDINSQSIAPNSTQNMDCTEFGITNYEIQYDQIPNSVLPPTEFGITHHEIPSNPIQNSVLPTTKICNTNTYITTKTTQKTSQENTHESTTEISCGEKRKNLHVPTLFISKDKEDSISLELLREEREIPKSCSGREHIQFLIDKNNKCIQTNYEDLLTNSDKIFMFLQRIEIYTKQSKAKKDQARFDLLDKWLNNTTLENFLTAIDTIESSIAMGICSNTITPKYLFEALLRTKPDDLSHLEPDGDDYKYVCKCGHKTKLYEGLRNCAVCGTAADPTVTEEGSRIY